ncbi:hypothetical protein [Streptomyces sp. NPDC010273]|uniref:AtuA-related protein n=1 Tax=Streptomyces sp. NPDC010273 TaxID=3364829 RepID=UPI0036EB81A6
MSRTRTGTPAGPRRGIRIGCGAGFADDRVLHDALDGGVTRSLALDAHGKSLASCLLEMDVPDLPPPTDSKNSKAQRTRKLEGLKVLKD